MKIGVVLSVTCLACAMLSADTSQDAVRMLATAPLRFEPSSDGRFAARGTRYQFEFERDGAVLQSGGKTVRLKFQGAGSSARLEGIDKLRSTTNVLRGNDPRKWRTGIANYGKLQVHGLYPGVDLVYYGNGSELEYDLVVQPGVDPRQIRLRFEGARPHLDRDGNLLAGFIQKRAVAYQLDANGTRIPVESRYRRNSDGSYGFSLGRYDHSREVVIDPALTLSLFLAGSNQDIATAIGHDAAGFIYVAGTTTSTDFLSGGANSGLTGTQNLFLVVIDPNQPFSSQVALATYIGGNIADTLGGMYVAPNGNVYLTGNTTSNDFPIVNGFQTILGGTSDAFIMLVQPFQGANMINYSTFLGGTGDDFGNGITTDKNGRIFVTGKTTSSDFTVTNGFQTTGAPPTAFLAGLDLGANAIFYSTYIGGSGGDVGRDVAVAPDGTVWVVGGTYSGGDFPVDGPAYQGVYGGVGDAFAVQIDPSKSGSASELYATFLGGSGTDEAKKVIIDPTGRVIICGYTGSPDFPVTGNAMQTNYGGNYDAFVSILNPKSAGNRASQLAYSTFYGGNQPDFAYDMKRDSAGNLYLTGFTMSPDLPVTGTALQPVSNLSLNAFALSFIPEVAGRGAMTYSSYIESDGQQIGYGVDYGANSTIYVTGYTTGPLFDSLGGDKKGTNPGNTDGFLMGMSACSFTLDNLAEQFPEGGGSKTIKLTASSPSCSWSVVVHDSWISVGPTSGTGNGTLTMTAAPNTSGASRTTTVFIGGVIVAVGQDQ